MKAAILGYGTVGSGAYECLARAGYEVKKVLDIQRHDELGSMTMQIRCGGPIGGITCVSNAVGNVRGYVLEPHVPLMEKYPGKLDVGATVGTDGTMTIIRDLQMKEPYVGSRT